MGAWESHEVARYIAEMCVDLKQLALDASLDDLAKVIDAAKEAALAEASKRKPSP